jgi:hypothetical protein
MASLPDWQRRARTKHRHQHQSESENLGVDDTTLSGSNGHHNTRLTVHC